MTFDLNYPRDLKENLVWRYKLLTKADSDIDLQKLLKAYCRHDLIFFINVFVYTYDTRKTFFSIVDLPFILFPAQERVALEIRSSIDNEKDRLIEKSREEGGTWLVLAIFAHLWNFEEGGSSLIGSITEDLIHKQDDMSTLFPKLDYMIDRLPKWLKPKGYDKSKHSNYMKIFNPELNNTITGSVGDNFGRSGRYRAMFMDELPAWRNGGDRKAWTSAHQSTKSRITVGTPLGQYGLYYEMASDTSNTAIDKSRIHWSEDPRKNEDLEYLDCDYTDYLLCPAKNENLYLAFKGSRSKEPKLGYTPTSKWYRSECLRMVTDPSFGDKGIKQELDIIYLGTGQTYFNQDIVEEQRMLCKSPIAKGTLEIVNKAKSNDKWEDFYDQRQKFVEFVENPMGNFWIWEYPIEDPYTNQYAVGADYAKGLLGVNDYGVIEVFDRESRRTVARFHDKVDNLGEICEMVYEYYNRACVFNPDATATSPLGVHLYNKNIPILTIYNETKKKSVEQGSKGFVFTSSSKANMFDSYRQHLQERDFYDPDERLWLQMQSFINDRGVLKGAGKGELQSHDDIVDTKGLTLYCADRMPALTREKYNRHLVEAAQNFSYTDIDDHTEGNDGYLI